MRRIQSLKHRIQKAEHVPPDARIIRQLHEEWSAILNAPGFYKGFVHWIHETPELVPVPHNLPDFEYLFQ